MTTIMHQLSVAAGGTGSCDIGGSIESVLPKSCQADGTFCTLGGSHCCGPHSWKCDGAECCSCYLGRAQIGWSHHNFACRSANKCVESAVQCLACVGYVFLDLAYQLLVLAMFRCARCWLVAQIQ